MYISTLMLTGQGGPDANNLPWYTKAVVLLTGIFSVAVFAIPASMLTWGFEAEAERLAVVTRRRKQRQKQKAEGTAGYVSSSSSSEWISSEGSETTDEEYQKIIAGEGDEGPTEEEKMQKLLAAFRSADTDGSGGLNADEFSKYLKENIESVEAIMGQPPADDDGTPATRVRAADKTLRIRVQKLEDKMDLVLSKLDQVLVALQK